MTKDAGAASGVPRAAGPRTEGVHGSRAQGAPAPLLPADEGAHAVRVLHLGDRLRAGDALSGDAGRFDPCVPYTPGETSWRGTRSRTLRTRPSAAPRTDAHAGHEAHMVGDMLRRFVGSAILTVPVNRLLTAWHFDLWRTLTPVPGAVLDSWSFVLTSIVVWWGGWPFVSSAARRCVMGGAHDDDPDRTGILVSYVVLRCSHVRLSGRASTMPRFHGSRRSASWPLASKCGAVRHGPAVEALLELARPPRGGCGTGRRRKSRSIWSRWRRPRRSAGDTIPVERRVIEGSSYIDESMITESRSPCLGAGRQRRGRNPKPAGSVPGFARPKSERTRVGSHRRHGSEAQSSKAPAQRLADIAAISRDRSARVRRRHVRAWIVFGHQGVAFALSAAVAAIVIACPDALALPRQPRSRFLWGGSPSGVLFRNAAVLEVQARSIRSSSTRRAHSRGRPSVTDVIPVGRSGGGGVLRLAAPRMRSPSTLRGSRDRCAKQRKL